MCEYVQAKEVNCHGLVGRGLFVYSSFNINICLKCFRKKFKFLNSNNN